MNNQLSAARDLVEKHGADVRSRRRPFYCVAIDKDGEAVIEIRRLDCRGYYTRQPGWQGAITLTSELNDVFEAGFNEGAGNE